MTLNEVGPLFYTKRNKQLWSNSEGWNLKKFKQLEGKDMSQVDSKKRKKDIIDVKLYMGILYSCNLGHNIYRFFHFFGIVSLHHKWNITKLYHQRVS